ncbi:glycosyltransferase BC10 isoform X1 [Juglans microcarpa x Juglans regia]|uniref:glycosyltransferase BC10 isoform X1 n=1 Tax=Juglans microcarpa x Juglans regia TaxID=2249226 RepID=UPI001B7E231E|nr:glycosyltransferase BC10 isoform X1 [Juglans microcarpa x Juglans regia]
MQSRWMALEEGKDPSTTVRTNQFRAFPLKVLQFFLIFLVLGLGISIVSMYMTRYFKVQIVAPVAESTLRPCLDEQTTVESWIRPPSNLLHTMNDTHLLWLASSVPRIKTYPFKRVPKIAFMFLTKGPLPMSPLWERFFKGNEGLYSIYVHSLPSYNANFTTSSVFYRRQIPSLVAEWGRMSMCDAERRLLANALLDISNEWFVLLSETCIPLHNFSIIYHYISRSRYSFVGSIDELGPYGRGRYNQNMTPEVNLTDWRKGSQWFEVNRELAVKIVEDTTYYPKFKEFCQPACYVDEHYFQTMLSIETPHLLANRSLTYVDWSRGGAHPATFGKADINEDFFKKIFESKTCIYNNQPSSLCFLFARKFSPSALDPLLGLSSKVLGF